MRMVSERFLNLDAATQVLAVASNLSRVASHLEYPPQEGHAHIVQLFLGQSVAYIGLMLRQGLSDSIQSALVELLPLLGGWVSVGNVDNPVDREQMVRDLRIWGERLMALAGAAVA